MTDNQNTTLNYEERQAVAVLRKAISRGRMYVLDALYKDLSRDALGRGLLATKQELDHNLQAVRALQAAVQNVLNKQTD